MPRSRSRSFESMTRVMKLLVLAERAGLAQHVVDQRGLPVVDVRDDGDVSYVFHRILQYTEFGPEKPMCGNTRSGRGPAG